MLIILWSLITTLVFFSFVFFSYFVFSSRSESLKSYIVEFLSSILKTNVTKFLFLLLFISFLTINLIGNIPINNIPTLFYSQTVTISLLFWIPIIVCVLITNFKGFISHMLPYGSPAALILFLPLVEIFSQIIRPFTLMIRLRTNLARGHIIMYMFSYFTLLSSTLAPFIHIVLSVLLILEVCISILQAYIFVSLLALYVNETV